MHYALSGSYLIFAAFFASCQVSLGKLNNDGMEYAVGHPPFRLYQHPTFNNKVFLKRSGVLDKVKIEVYYETDCPDSKRFINLQLYPTFEALGDIMDIYLIPYGKATETALPNGDFLFKCHHGPSECYGNTVQSCAIDMYKKPEEHLSFIKCMESYWRPSESAERCARRLEMNWDKIRECAEGRLGMGLLHVNAQRTIDLNPPLTYVPWIVINNEYTDENQNLAQRNLKRLICDTYTGPKHKNCEDA